MAVGISAISAQVQSYFEPANQKVGLDILVRDVFAALKNASPLERWELICFVRRTGKKQDASDECFKKLKALICQGANKSWKNLLLNSHYENKLTLLHTQIFTYSNSLDHAIDSKKRFSHFSEAPFSAFFGSTFATNHPDKFNDQGHHLLDSACAAVCKDRQGDFAGYSLAVADGGGGHLGDAQQDLNIARAAYGATQACVRLFSAYDAPDALFNDLSNILKFVGKEVQRVGKGESTTLVACRAFPVQEGFRLIGLNVGDSMLISWHPTMQKVHHLLPSHNTRGGTALLPESYKDFEICRIDVTLPKDSLLFLMSDGVHDTLPHSEQEEIYPNTLTFRTRTLTDIENLLYKIPSEKCLKAIFRKSVDGAEKLRKEHRKTPHFHMGDDFTLLQCCL